MARTLTQTEARGFIAAHKLGHLACITNNQPYVVPINYIFTEGEIYSHSLPGLKIDAMRAQPRVCLQVEQIEDNFNWRSVVAYGAFEEINVPSERNDVLGKLLAEFPLLTPVESLLANDGGAPDSVVFRIVVDRLTGVAEESVKELWKV